MAFGQYDSFGLPVDPPDISSNIGTLAKTVAAKVASAPSSPAPPVLAAQPSAPTIAVNDQSSANIAAPPAPAVNTNFGPPALARTPDVNYARPGAPTVLTVNPNNTTLAQQGALRPATGPNSVGDLAPAVALNGDYVPTPPKSDIAAPVATPTTAAAAASPATSGVPDPAASVVTPAAPAAPTGSSASFAGASGGASTAAPTPATSINGRPLGYGRMIDGVRTFNDSDIAAINKAPSRLTPGGTGIGGNIASEANGGVTPELGSTGTVARSTVDPAVAAYQRAQSDNLLAQRNAASDIASIANGDTRSVAGNAARNARVEGNSSIGNPRARAAAEAATLGNLRAAAVDGVGVQANLGQTLNTQAGDNFRTSVNDAGANSRNALSSKTELQKAALDISKPTYQTDAQGRTIRISGTTATPVTDAAGNPITQAANKNEFTEAHAKAWENLSNEQVPTDADPNKTRPLTYEEKVARYNALTGGHATVPQQTNIASAPSGKTVGTATATAADGTKLKLSPDGKSWIKA